MIEVKVPGGLTIRVSGLPFARRVDARVPIRKQQQQVKVGNWVRLMSGAGPISYAVIAVARDGLSWRDENAEEHPVSDVLT